MMPILRPDEPHEHWFACIRCGVDHPTETRPRKKRAQPVQNAPRSTKAKRAEPCATKGDR
jgi:hypothetical protein